MEAILQCLADGKWHLPEEVVPFVEDRFCTLGREVSEATIYNAFKRLKTLRKIDHQYNRYRIAEVIINGKKD